MCGRWPNLELAFLRRLFNDENRGRPRILFRFGLHSQLDHQDGLSMCSIAKVMKRSLSFASRSRNASPTIGSFARGATTTSQRSI